MDEEISGYGIAYDSRGTIYIGLASRVQKEIDEVMVAWENEIVVLEFISTSYANLVKGLFNMAWKDAKALDDFGS